MAQTPARPTLARSAYQPAASGDDLDALLDSIMGEDPGTRQDRTSGSAREVMKRRLEQQRGDERHATDDSVNEELRAQIRALARQVQALTEASAQHTVNARAINELRQGMRDMLAANPQPRPAPSHLQAEVQLPSIKIKLVLAQAAHLIHQSDRDVTMLSAWSMLFGGIGIGACLSIALDLAGLQSIQRWIFLAVVCFAIVVAFVFALLAWQAHRRTKHARKDMEDSAVTRTVPMN
jgi:hypothetical protein